MIYEIVQSIFIFPFEKGEDKNVDLLGGCR